MKEKLETVTFISWISILLCVIVFAITYYNYNKTIALENTIKYAIEKGIDPIAVKCAFDDYSSASCQVYLALSTKNTLQK